MAWCFAVSQAPATVKVHSGARFGGLGAAFWSWVIVGSESDVRQWKPLAGHRFRSSVARRKTGKQCQGLTCGPCIVLKWFFATCFGGLGAAGGRNWKKVENDENGRRRMGFFVLYFIIIILL